MDAIDSNVISDVEVVLLAFLVGILEFEIRRKLFGLEEKLLLEEIDHYISDYID